MYTFGHILVSGCRGVRANVICDCERNQISTEIFHIVFGTCESHAHIFKA